MFAGITVSHPWNKQCIEFSAVAESGNAMLSQPIITLPETDINNKNTTLRKIPNHLNTPYITNELQGPVEQKT